MTSRIAKFLIPAAIALVTISTLNFIPVNTTANDPIWENVVLEAQEGGYKLITTKELAKLFKDTNSNLLVVDTRQSWEFRTGHIEGAINFPIEPTVWARLKGKSTLPAVLGPDKERMIVFY